MKLEQVPGHTDLKREIGSGKIYVRMYREDKGRLFKSTKTSNVREARKIADLYIQEFFNLQPKQKLLPLIEELWPKWLETKAEKSKNTLESIKYSWARLKPFWGDLLPSEISQINWEDYVSSIRAQDPDTKFFNDRKWLNGFIIWLHDNGFIEKRPRLRNPDPSKSDAGKYVSQDEFKKLIEHCHPDLQLMALMGYTMGMRISEIACLTWGADREGTSFVDLEKKIIHLHKKDTKIRRSRTFGISEIVYPELVLRHKSRVSEWVFPSPQDAQKRLGRDGHKTAWNNARLNSGVKCRFHDLRHSFLTNAFKAGQGKIDSALICEYAGLSIEVAQKVYLHFTYEDTRAVSSLITL